MAAGFGTSPFVLPQMFQPPGQALDNKLDRDFREKQTQAEWDWRKQRQQEQDDWRKLGLIQELTDIDKYQTGEAVADAIGHQKANELFSKYTSLSSSMSPAELQYKISQEIGATTNAMRALKDELILADQQVKARKTQFPSLDSGSLMRDVRADIINRRIRGNELANPMTISPSQLNLDDLEYISDYIDVNKGLKDAVVNPKNIQKGVDVLTGSPSSYVKFKGDLPYYMKENFDRTKDFKEGFYSGKQEPTMSLRTTTIPQGSFSGTNQPIEVLDEDAYIGLVSESSEVEPALIKLAKTKYKNYSSMSNSEKEIAKRDVAKDFITPFSRNYQFRAESATKPPRISVNTGGGSSSEESNINNIYERIKKKGLQRVEDYKGGKYFDNSLDVSDLDGEELEAALKATKNSDLNPEDIKIIVEDNGRIGVYNKGDGKRLVYLNQTGTNLPKQANVKGKQASVQKGNESFKPITVDVEEEVDFNSLDPNGFKKDGKYWRYKDGRLFDDKGKLIKQ